MSLCQCTRDGEHRWEFTGHSERADWYVCINAMCGETKAEYQDTEEGG